jgi:hypothetical protein
VCVCETKLRNARLHSRAEWSNFTLNLCMHTPSRFYTTSRQRPHAVELLSLVCEFRFQHSETWFYTVISGVQCCFPAPIKHFGLSLLAYFQHIRAYVDLHTHVCLEFRTKWARFINLHANIIQVGTCKGVKLKNITSFIFRGITPYRVYGVIFQEVKAS